MLLYKNQKYFLGILYLLSENEVVTEKVEQLKTWIEESKHTVFYTGAGVRICLPLRGKLVSNLKFIL